MHGEMRNAYIGVPEGRRPCGRPRHRWEHNIKMDLKEVGREVVGWILLT
jgi:hypothetical protein